MGLAGGDGEVGVADAGVEIVGLALEAILVGAGLAKVVAVAAAGSAEGARERGEKEESEVWL